MQQFSLLFAAAGIGWCVVFILASVILNKVKGKKETSGGKGGGGGQDGAQILQDLKSKVESVKKEYVEVRFDEIKNFHSAYARNPHAFKEINEAYLKEQEKELGNIDNSIKSIIEKTASAIESVVKGPVGGGSGDKASDNFNIFIAKINSIGVIGMVGFIVLTAVTYLIK